MKFWIAQKAKRAAVWKINRGSAALIRSEDIYQLDQILSNNTIL